MLYVYEMCVCVRMYDTDTQPSTSTNYFIFKLYYVLLLFITSSNTVLLAHKFPLSNRPALLKLPIFLQYTFIPKDSLGRCSSFIRLALAVREKCSHAAQRRSRLLEDFTGSRKSIHISASTFLASIPFLLSHFSSSLFVVVCGLLF